MWNDEWERLNQEKLKQWYMEQVAADPLADGPVRRIICAGCDQVFYTMVKSKKYCDYNTCGRIGNYRLQKQHRLEKRQNRVCAGCGQTFTPKRSDARYCSNACRQRAYRESHRVTDTLSAPKEDLAQP